MVQVRRSICVLGLVGLLVGLGLAGSSGAAAATPRPQLSVLLIGDSYAAGNGAGSYYGPKGCFRSRRNWAEQYVTTLRPTHRVGLLNRACSGAVTRDMWQSQKENPPQIESVSGDLDLVLLSVGGNDLFFSTIVKQCFAILLRDAPTCRSRIADSVALVDEVRRRTVALLRGVKARLRPGAKIVLTSYPYLEVNPGLRLGQLLPGAGGLYPVGAEVRALADRGEQAQREAVAKVNGQGGVEVIYMDQIKALFAGHEPDGRTSRQNSDRWLHEFDTLQRAEWYHYNAKGHKAIAGLLAEHGTFGVVPAN